MPDFDIDAALTPTTFACEKCRQPTLFHSLVFPEYDKSYANYLCYRCNDIRKVPVRLLDVQTDVASEGAAEKIRTGRCPYDCGMCCMTPGKSTQNGNWISVRMTCDDCGGRWTEIGALQEDFDA